MDEQPQPTSDLVAELEQLRARVAQLEGEQAEYRQAAAERALALAALRESETRLRHIAHNMLDVVGLADLNGVYQYVSPSIKTIAGYEPSDIVGQTMFEHIHPDDLFRMIRVSMRTLRAGNTGRMEIRYQHAAGHYIMLEAVGTPARDEEGHIIGAVMSARDITDRKQAEDRLWQAQQTYLGIINSVTEAIYIQAQDGTFRYVNQTSERWYGYASADFMGRTPEFLSAPGKNDLAAVAELVQAAYAGTPQHFEFWGRRRDGSIFPKEVNVTPGTYMGEQVVIAVARDITERKRAEEALRESESLYQSLVEISAQSICRKDLAGRFTFANRRFLEASNCTLADIVGRDDYDLHPPHLAEKYRRDDRMVIDSGQAREFIEERAILGGETQVIQSSKTPVYDGAGKIIGIQISFWDITARQRAEQAAHDQRELADSLREVAVLLNSTRDYNTVIEQILLNIGRVVPHTTANVMLIDEPAGVARVIRAHGHEQISPDLARQLSNFSLPLTLTNLRSMINTRQPVIINDTLTSPDWVVTPETAWTRSYLGAPIVLRDQTLGLINLDSDQPEFFTAEHARRLMTFAAQAASAIENARLFEAERDARQQAETLRDTAAALSHSLNLDEVLNEILILVERVVASDGANLLLVRGNRVGVVRVSGRCPLESIDREEHIIDEIHQLRLMRDTGHPCIVERTHDDPTWRVLPGYEWIASYAGVPIRVHGEILSFLGLYSTRPGHFSRQHMDRLQAFANQIALAVHNAQLHASIQQHADELEQRVLQRTRELTAANEQLTHLDRLKDQFISRISHELRTPLTNIKIYLELLESGKPEKRAKYLQTLNEQTARLQQLIESLLEVTQQSVNVAGLHLAPIDLNHLATSLIADTEPRAALRGLRLNHTLAPALPLVLADTILLTQALVNLVTNAINYTPPGGTIDLSTAQVMDCDTTWITITVQDTGPGITPADLPHIFERFYRGRAAADYKTPGTGVGLFISQNILISLEGRLTVTSEGKPGRGARFTAWLKPAT